MTRSLRALSSGAIIGFRFFFKFYRSYFTIIFLSFLFFFFLNWCLSTVISTFTPPPLSPVPPTTTSHPQSFPLLALFMCPLYEFLDDPSPSFPHYFPPSSPLVTVSLFFISTSLVLFCLLVCFVD